MNEENGDYGKEIFRVGKCVLTDECIYIDLNNRPPYVIIKERIWELRPDDKKDKFDWPLHLVEKTWLTIDDIYHFNTVFLYALDYFQDITPIEPSFIWKTLEEQKYLVEDRKTDYRI